MKRIFFGLIATALFSVSGFADTVKSENKTLVGKVTFDKVVGICHIEITRTNRDGSTSVQSWDLPCNTAAQCEQMLKDTLAAYN